MRISTSDQGLIVAEIDRAKGQEFIHPPVSDLSYQLAVYADGPLGDNPFFAIDVVLVPDNPHELADAANDQLAGAEPVALTGSFRRRGLLLSTLGAGDVDYYSIQVGAGEHVAVACEGESAGSGVRALRVELRDASDAVLGASEESAAQSFRSEPVLVAAAGTYYLRLSSGAGEQAPAVEPWARCSLAVGP